MMTNRAVNENEIDVDELVAQLRCHALHLIAHAEFWEIRIHGGNGKARIELIQQTEPVSYRRPRGGQLLVRKSKQ